MKECQSTTVCQTLSFSKSVAALEQSIKHSASNLTNIRWPFVCRIMFQELMLIAALGWISVIVETAYYSLSSKKGDDPTTVDPGFPLVFIAMLILIRAFENRILQEICFYLGFPYARSGLPYRILYKIGILGVLIGIYWISLAFEPVGQRQVGMDMLDFARTSKQVLRLWLQMTSKLLGSFVTITITRIYMDIWIYSMRLIFGIPEDSSAGDENSPVRQKRKLATREG